MIKTKTFYNIKGHELEYCRDLLLDKFLNTAAAIYTFLGIN